MILDCRIANAGMPPPISARACSRSGMARVHEAFTSRSWGYKVAIPRIGSIRPRNLRAPLFLFTVGVLCLFWIQAWAGVPTEQLRGSVDRVIQILEDPKLKAE